MPRNQKPDRPRASTPVIYPGALAGGPLPLSAQSSTEFTGRYLVLFDESRVEEGVRTLERSVGVSLSETTTTEAPATTEVLLPTLGVGVTTLDPTQLQEVSVAAQHAEPGVLAVEPERMLYALGAVLGPSVEPAETEATVDEVHDQHYLSGYRDGVNELIERLLQNGATQVRAPGRSARRVVERLRRDERMYTWGLQATRSDRTRYTGRGTRIAVLDTGFGPHPDFATRPIISQSFVAGQAVLDGNGHGTHCVGTVGGPAKPGAGPRYGVAPEVDLCVGKVLSNAGSGREGDILAGVAWAIEQGCVVVSMSLGAPVYPGAPHSAVFEGVAQRALRRGTLIVAAAGNESRRPGSVWPVGHPANCPSVLAVAALDSGLRVTLFSNGGINPNGGEVDIAGPGMDIYSSYPFPQPGVGPYRRLSGTSMATPHVAGIAALVHEATGAVGRDLWNALLDLAHALPLSASDVGKGLVQAP